MAGVVVANVVRQHPVFHPNLMRLVASVFVHWLAATLCRFAMVVWLFFDRRQLVSDDLFLLSGSMSFLEMARIFGYATILGTIVSVIVERSIATIKLKSYEHQRSNFMVVVAVVYSWGIGAIATYVVWQNWLPMIYPVAAGVLYVMQFLATFVTVEYINRRRYDRSRRGIQTFTLSQRFQLSENLRSLTVIRRCAYVGGVGFGFAFSVVGTNSYLKTDSSLYITRALLNFTAYAASFAFVATAVASVRIWRKECRRTFTSIKRSICDNARTSIVPMPSRAASMSQLYDTCGEKMHFSAKEEQDIYFKQLQQAWT
ncbi:Protein SRE-3 [Aphelenchoides avenae]|nr:Protein SRE-3 [Aphelenchus avenae]